MGCIYGFWRQLNKEQKSAKQRYTQLLYNLLFGNCVGFLTFYPLLKLSGKQQDRIQSIWYCIKQVKTVPLRVDEEAPQPPPPPKQAPKATQRQVCYCPVPFHLPWNLGELWI